MEKSFLPRKKFIPTWRQLRTCFQPFLIQLKATKGRGQQHTMASFRIALLLMALPYMSSAAREPPTITAEDGKVTVQVCLRLFGVVAWVLYMTVLLRRRVCMCCRESTAPAPAPAPLSESQTPIWGFKFCKPTRSASCLRQPLPALVSLPSSAGDHVLLPVPHALVFLRDALVALR